MSKVSMNDMDALMESMRQIEAARQREMMLDLRAQHIRLKRDIGGEELTDDEQAFLEERRRKAEEFVAKRDEREAEARRNAMTVGQLIERLSALDPNLPVRVVEGYHDWDEPWAGEWCVEQTDDGAVRIGG